VERIRALDAYAIGGLGTLAHVAQMTEFESPLAQEHYVQALIAAHGKLVSDAAHARDIAGVANDAESQDLMIARRNEHRLGAERALRPRTELQRVRTARPLGARQQ
jgi:DNA-binding ferritin-like protein